jgi:putative acetyltransferase
MKTRQQPVKLRPASRDDFEMIEAVHRAAFSICEFGYNGEGSLARELHEAGDSLVSLLAMAEGIPVGHVLFSRMQVDGDGQPLIAAMMAPLGVVPMWSRKGVASQLVKAGLAALKVQGVQLCFVVGHPTFYQRFGFSPEASRPFTSPYSGNYFMALKLDDTLKMPAAGVAEFSPVFARF